MAELMKTPNGNFCRICQNEYEEEIFEQLLSDGPKWEGFGLSYRGNRSCDNLTFINNTKWFFKETKDK